MVKHVNGVSKHFTGRFTAKQRVNVDFRLGLLRLIDQECEKIGIPRQAWIKMVCDEKIRSVKSNRASIKAWQIAVYGRGAALSVGRRASPAYRPTTSRTVLGLLRQ